jgi:hypothetical protein
MSTQSPRALMSVGNAETASMQSLEVQLASLQLLLQSVSRRVFRWLTGGFQLLAISFVDINRPWIPLPLVVSIVLVIIGALCFPGSLTLATCVDWGMQVVVCLFLVQVVSANLWAVRWLTRLWRADRLGCCIFLLALFLYRKVILYRLLRLRAYIHTKHAIATIFVRQPSLTV